MKHCSLNPEWNKCEYFDRESETCKAESTQCCFAEKDNTPEKYTYVRKPRWYEQYYQKRTKSCEINPLDTPD